MCQRHTSALLPGQSLLLSPLTFSWLCWLLQSRWGCLAQLQHLSCCYGSSQSAEQGRGSAGACQASGEAFLLRIPALASFCSPAFCPSLSCVCWWWSWMGGHGLWVHCRLSLEPAFRLSPPHVAHVFPQPAATQSSKRSVVLLWLIVTVVVTRLHITASYHERNPILI